jgi:hypothetical protein
MHNQHTSSPSQTRPSEVMLPKTPQESLPPGWRVDLEMVQTGGVSFTSAVSPICLLTLL